MKPYSTPTQPLPLVSDDMDVNAPLIHQQIIARLTMELGILYHKQRRIAYEPLPETMLLKGMATRLLTCCFSIMLPSKLG